ncbi:site-specific integrase [Streptosporangium sp. NPDC020145]|uniref:tyrosine-type recombinase/integrase n=1 Tax=Streptosporangium sp. NPDC020145 TaxID=3154694 RepID=UPI003417E9FF
MTEKSPRKERTRGNRDGRPFQRASDGLWVATVYLPNGKRKPVYGKTRKEAADKKKKAENEIAAGMPVTVGRTDTLAHYLLKVWVTETLPQRVAAGKISASTLDSYRDMVEKHIVPHLGHLKLVELSTGDIRRWLLELGEKLSGRQRRKLRPGETELPPPVKLSPRTIAYAHAVLRKALADAVDDETLGRNVCLLVDAPASEDEEKEPLTREEAAQLLGEAAGDRLWAYWLMLLSIGLRRGEGLGMRWSLTDLDTGTARVAKTVQRLRGEKDEKTGKRKGQLVEKKLKTSASKATLALPKVAVEALREHRRIQAAERLAAKMWADPDLVFTTTIGTALEPRNVNREWDSLVARAGIGRKVRLHDLRHACATFLFAEGADPKTIQGVLRHTRQATTTDIYVHLLEEVKRSAADSMDSVLGSLVGLSGGQRKTAS